MGEHSSSRLREIKVEDLGELKELWRMKGVNESHTLVNGFKDVQTIHIKYCDNFTDIFTPTTTNFDLGALTYYHVSSWNHGDLEERERKRKMIESDQKINATYPSYLLHTCPQLQNLSLFNDGRVEEVTTISNNSTATTTSPPSMYTPSWVEGDKSCVEVLQLE
ncbi:hypothetical protein M8C21_000068 [Ambrosia artemisiifolia]|uniref:Disease resistance protein At4g27190-like leucine-rich repeats domain-containing protein n=1 Tax=Ambrosia artemisiifolia TaxID=4212 RepID=A0AAD5D3S5_AMBAR|nr:hypothetical protein M8C21_000068 [Ambrosia artemisiifolia]